MVPLGRARFHVDFEIEQAVLDVGIAATNLVVYFINANFPDVPIAAFAQYQH